VTGSLKSKPFVDQTFVNWSTVAIAPGPTGNFSRTEGFSIVGRDPDAVTDSTGTFLGDDLRLNQEKPVPVTSAPANASTTHSGGMWLDSGVDRGGGLVAVGWAPGRADTPGMLGWEGLKKSKLLSFGMAGAGDAHL